MVKVRSVSAWLAGILFSVSSAQAEFLEIGFEGTLTEKHGSASYLSQNVGDRVTGRIWFDTSVTLRDRDSSAGGIVYKKSIMPGSELQFLGTRIDGASFDFTPVESGKDSDSLALEPMPPVGASQRLFFEDSYSQNGAACQSATEVRCWNVQWAVRLPTDSLPVVWPQDFDLNSTDWLSGGIQFLLKHPSEGSLSGTITLDRLVAPAPDPLPASGWLFLAAVSLLTFREPATQVRRGHACRPA